MKQSSIHQPHSLAFTWVKENTRMPKRKVDSLTAKTLKDSAGGSIPSDLPLPIHDVKHLRGYNEPCVCLPRPLFRCPSILAIFLCKGKLDLSVSHFWMGFVTKGFVIQEHVLIPGVVGCHSHEQPSSSTTMEDHYQSLSVVIMILP